LDEAPLLERLVMNAKLGYLRVGIDCLMLMENPATTESKDELIESCCFKK
jgi:hypothetical protein